MIQYDVSQVTNGITFSGPLTYTNVGIVHNLSIYEILKQKQNDGYPTTLEEIADSASNLVAKLASDEVIIPESKVNIMSMINMIVDGVNQETPENTILTSLEEVFQSAESDPTIANDKGMAIISEAYYSALFWSQVKIGTEKVNVRKWAKVIVADLTGAAVGAEAGGILGPPGAAAGAGLGAVAASVAEALSDK